MQFAAALICSVGVAGVALVAHMTAFLQVPFPIVNAPIPHLGPRPALIGDIKGAGV